MNTKIRFVRCPKCQMVLPELAEVPVYKCGGCATVLQAKAKHGVDVDHPGESSGISIHDKEDEQKQSQEVDQDEDKSCNSDGKEAFFSTELGSCDEIEKQSSVSDDQFQTHDLGSSYIGGSHPPLNMKSECSCDEWPATEFHLDDRFQVNSKAARSSWSRSTRNSEPNKLELLRMVYELEDELRQTRMANFADHSRYRTHFSAEVTHYRHQPDCQCLNCSPQVRHFSAQFPPPVPYGYCNSAYSTSEYSLDYRRQKLDEEMKRLHLREKYSRMRHLRPVAGGAPIVICHYCRELVQLPAHFLLFKRKVHQLRCNACRKILSFSLQHKINLIPLYTQAAEVDANYTEPISRSHDLGPSFCSTQGESFNKSTKHRKMKSHKYTSHSAPSPLHRLMGYSSPSQVIQ